MSLSRLIKTFSSLQLDIKILNTTLIKLSLCHVNLSFVTARFMWGTRWRSWLRHCATSRKVAGSIPDDGIGILHLHNPSGRSMALGLTQPLTEMSTRNISRRVKAAGA